MNRQSILQTTCLVAATLLMAACTQDELADAGGTTALPEGKYPVTFTTAVEGPTLTRANTAEGQWTTGDKIAMQVGSDVKQYTPATSGSSSATLQAASGVEPFYWQTSGETKTVSAWYCGTEYKSTLPATWAVKSNQNANGGYQQSDFLYAPATTISFANRNSASLKFYHQTAKVVINIVNKEVATNADAITNVVIGNSNNIALSGTYAAPASGATAGTWSTNTTGTGTITPKEITAASGYLKSYTALVIPQNMTGQKFIAVTLTDGSTYYYTPKNSDGNLLSGKQHTYNITVKGTELVVTAETPVSWDDSDISGSSPTEATPFRVTFSGSPLPTLSDLNKISHKEGNIYETNGNTFSFNIPKDGKKGIFIRGGLADVERQESGDKITYTYTNVRSDLMLVYSDKVPPHVGDYYYADGTWSVWYDSNYSAACIGIVFKVGAGTGDTVSNYDGKLSSEIRGYVVALNDAHPEAGVWGIRWIDESGLTNGWSNKYDGYSNTRFIRNLGEKYNNTDVNNPTYDEHYWAFKVASQYNVAAPAGSSGWYLPSIAQLTDIYNMRNRAALLQHAGGSDFQAATIYQGRYWSSTEYDNYRAWCYLFSKYNEAKFIAKNDDGFRQYSYVRAILTF